MNNTYLILIIGGVAVLLLLAVGAFFLSDQPGETADGPGAFDSLAQCLEEKGATFWGAFWCPHCQEQKRLFGASEKHLPYVECSTLDGQSQLPRCTEANIRSYPTWEFADGERITRVMTPEELAEKTGCALAGEAEDALPEAKPSEDQDAPEAQSSDALPPAQTEDTGDGDNNEPPLFPEIEIE